MTACLETIIRVLLSAGSCVIVIEDGFFVDKPRIFPLPDKVGIACVVVFQGVPVHINFYHQVSPVFPVYAAFVDLHVMDAVDFRCRVKKFPNLFNKGILDFF